MFLKSKLAILFVSALTISYFTSSLFNESVNAQDTKAPQSASTGQKDCPLGKGGKPACNTASECSSHPCGKQSHCKQDPCCASKSGCKSACDKNPCEKTPCAKKGGNGHCATEMIGLVHCAKKELMKEKVKAKLNAKMGNKLDKVADLLVDAMLEEYKAGRASKERREELQKKMIEIFSGKK